MPPQPRPSNRRNRPVSLDPKSLTLAELNDLPRKSLILLASARNLVTTGTKTRLAQRVFEHERADDLGRHDDPPPPASNENPGEIVDGEQSPRSPNHQQHPSSSQFSHGQLSQLRDMIAEVVGPQRTGPSQAPILPPEVPLLSPASVLNSALNASSGQNLQNIQDGGLSQHQLVPSLPPALGSGNSSQPSCGSTLS